MSSPHPPHPTPALHSCLSSCTTITEHLLFARHKARTSDESLKGFVNQGVGAEAQLVQSVLLKREDLSLDARHL